MKEKHIVKNGGGFSLFNVVGGLIVRLVDNIRAYCVYLRTRRDILTEKMLFDMMAKEGDIYRGFVAILRMHGFVVKKSRGEFSIYKRKEGKDVPGSVKRLKLHESQLHLLIGLSIPALSNVMSAIQQVPQLEGVQLEGQLIRFVPKSGTYAFTMGKARFNKEYNKVLYYIHNYYSAREQEGQG